MADEAQIPGANVLVAALDRFVWGADAALTTVNLVNESFAIAREDDDVVPEGEHRFAQPEGVHEGTEVIDLGGLPGSIESGEADHNRSSFPRHVLPSRVWWNARGAFADCVYGVYRDACGCDGSKLN